MEAVFQAVLSRAGDAQEQNSEKSLVKKFHVVTKLSCEKMTAARVFPKLIWRSRLANGFKFGAKFPGWHFSTVPPRSVLAEKLCCTVLEGEINEGKEGQVKWLRVSPSLKHFGMFHNEFRTTNRKGFATCPRQFPSTICAAVSPNFSKSVEMTVMPSSRISLSGVSL